MADNKTSSEISKNFGQKNFSGNGFAPVGSSDSSECSVKPVLANLQNWESIRTEVTEKMAVELGLPAGVVKGSGSRRYYLREWSRTATCKSRDNGPKHVYGQAVRVIVVASDLDSSVSINFPAVAANSTLNRKSSDIRANIKGLTDVGLLMMANGIVGQLDVESYTKLDALITAVQDKALLTASKGEPVFLGKLIDPAAYRAAIVASYAVQKIADGSSCDKAQSSLVGINATDTALIQQQYMELTGVCDATDPENTSIRAAKSFLGNIKVKI